MQEFYMAPPIKLSQVMLRSGDQIGNIKRFRCWRGLRIAENWMLFVDWKTIEADARIATVQLDQLFR